MGAVSPPTRPCRGLKPRLALYGQPNAIEIQSYMWVVSYLIRDGNVGEKKTTSAPDFNSELTARARRAQERERIGLSGEQFVYEKERGKLLAIGRDDLANRVKVVSVDDEGGSGFDISSFNRDESELHIEVKTTVRSPEDDNGFWLSDTERSQAEKDSCWTVYRVWSIDLSPQYENIGNVVQNRDINWELRASSWFVQRK